jgi:hypothetical protein
MNKLVLPRVDDGCRSADSGSARPGPSGAATGSIWRAVRDNGAGSKIKLAVSLCRHARTVLPAAFKGLLAGVSGATRSFGELGVVDALVSSRTGGGSEDEAGCIAMSPREDKAWRRPKVPRRGMSGAATRSFLASCVSGNRIGSSRTTDAFLEVAGGGAPSSRNSDLSSWRA